MHEPARNPNDLEKFFVERANAGDVAGLVALYEPEAVLVAVDGKQVVGAEEIRKFFTRYLKDRPRLEESIQAPVPCCRCDPKRPQGGANSTTDFPADFGDQQCLRLVATTKELKPHPEGDLDDWIRRSWHQ